MFQFEELLIVAISKEESDTEQFLSKKIGVFIRVVEFLYGPVTNEWVSLFCIRSQFPTMNILCTVYYRVIELIFVNIGTSWL